MALLRDSEWILQILGDQSSFFFIWCMTERGRPVKWPAIHWQEHRLQRIPILFPRPSLEFSVVSIVPCYWEQKITFKRCSCSVWKNEVIVSPVKLSEIIGVANYKGKGLYHHKEKYWRGILRKIIKIVYGKTFRSYLNISYPSSLK